MLTHARAAAAPRRVPPSLPLQPLEPWAAMLDCLGAVEDEGHIIVLGEDGPDLMCALLRAGGLADGTQAVERRWRRLLQCQLGAPFENPTAFAGLVEMLLIFLIGVALTNAFGRMVGDQRHGWVLFAAMAMLFVAGLAVVYGSEAHPNPALSQFGLDQAAGNMEGKENRFGVGQSSLFATVTTASSDGAVNAMHDSFMPLSGLVLMANMMLDEVIVGGPGSGLFGIQPGLSSRPARVIDRGCLSAASRIRRRYLPPHHARLCTDDCHCCSAP